MGIEDQGILNGLSPEEILAEKERTGGIKYDDPSSPLSPEEMGIEPNGHQVPPPVLETPPPAPPIPPRREFVRDQSSPIEESLGRVETRRSVEPDFTPGLNLGWKNLPMKVLPSKGLFYPEGTKIAIRPASVKEIRHYSSIDEDDLIDLNERLNFIISKCSTVHFPGEGVVSYKDLKQEDRFFLIMAIRDLTFVQGENRIVITPKTKCEDKTKCTINQGIELRTGVLSSYEISDNIMKYYSPSSRNFIFAVKKIGKEIIMNVPSIGVTDSVSEFIREARRKGIEVEESFVDIAPFLFSDWRNLDYQKILSKMRESDDWSKEEFSLYFELSNTIKTGTKLDINIQCPTCGAEVTAPITFPKGFKSLFIISDIFRELL